MAENVDSSISHETNAATAQEVIQGELNVASNVSANDEEELTQSSFAPVAMALLDGLDALSSNTKRSAKLILGAIFDAPFEQDPDAVVATILESNNTEDITLSHFLAFIGHICMEHFLHAGAQKKDITCPVLANDVAYRIAVQTMTFEYPPALNALAAAAVARRRRYNFSKNPADIDAAISKFELAADGIRDDDSSSNKFDRLLGLAECYDTRFKFSRNVVDISNAILSQQRAIGAAPEGYVANPATLETLAGMYRNRFEHLHTRDMSDLSKAIMYQREAIDLTPKGDTKMKSRTPILLTTLGDLHYTYFVRTGDLTRHSEGVKCYEKAISLTSEDHRTMPTILNNMGKSYRAYFHHTANLADIREAISIQRRAVELAHDDHMFKPEFLDDLGVSYRTLFLATGDDADISKAIAHLTHAVDLTPEGHENLFKRLTNLAASFTSRFQRTENLDDLSESISIQERIVTAKGHPERPATIGNLGSTYSVKYQHTNDIANLLQAISLQQEAVRLIHPEHTALPIILANLGSSYILRYTRTGDPGDADNAVASLQSAIDLTPKGDPMLPDWYSQLGIAYRSSSKDEKTSISMSISHSLKAVDLTPDGHPDKPHRVFCLGDAYKQLYEITNDDSDILTSIAHHEKAIQLTPSSMRKTQRSFEHHEGLGSAYLKRSLRTEDTADISTAILYLEKAQGLVSEDNPNLPGLLHLLGVCYSLRFILTGASADFLQSGHNYMQAATLRTASPSIRLRAANSLSMSFSMMLDLRESRLVGENPSEEAQSNAALKKRVIDGYQTAIPLIHQTVSLEKTVQNRHRALSETNLLHISEMTSAAAAAAIDAEMLDIALQWLEEGRCVVWNQLNNLRTPLDSLRIQDQQMADEVSRISRALEIAGLQLDDNEASKTRKVVDLYKKIISHDEISARIKLADEWEKILSKVREIPGFQDFLLPLSSSTILERLPKSGRVILINVHRKRCDALILESGKKTPMLIPLPEFSYTKAEVLRNNLQDLFRSRNIRMRGDNNSESEDEKEDDKSHPIRASRVAAKMGVKLVDILRHLWVEVVVPILNGLGYSKPPSKLFRIWWCATGPLAFLPIHAAGIYSASDSVPLTSLSDYAISSYTPTVRALIDRPQPPRRGNSEQNGILLISQPNTPKMSPIPNTTEEVHLIQQLMQDLDLKVSCLEGADATVESVKTEMEMYNCIHFACHASQNTSDPLKSGFALHDGRLELSMISQKNLVGADLAFLSACQTSTGDERLSEEAVHLAAGMLAAGYQSVVATMWSIQDRHAPKMAEDFYQRIVQEEEYLKGENASDALHFAVQNLRRRLASSSTWDVESSLLIWVPYVHFGL